MSTKNKIKIKNKIFSRPTYLIFFAKEAGNRTIFCFGLIIIRDSKIVRAL